MQLFSRMNDDNIVSQKFKHRAFRLKTFTKKTVLQQLYYRNCARIFWIGTLLICIRKTKKGLPYFKNYVTHCWRTLFLMISKNEVVSQKFKIKILSSPSNWQLFEKIWTFHISYKTDHSIKSTIQHTSCLNYNIILCWIFYRMSL